MSIATALLLRSPSIKSILRHGQIKVYGAVRIVRNVQFPSLRMTSFSGLQGPNAFGTMVQPGCDFYSIEARAISNCQGKSRQFVPRAMFTEKAQKVIMLAQEKAKCLGHRVVWIEQLLLGIIGEGSAAKVLQPMGINLEEARTAMEKMTGWGSGIVSGEIPFSPPTKHVLELSREEALELGQSSIQPEHLLLGLLRDGESAGILLKLGADTNILRKQVIEMVKESSESVGEGLGGGSASGKIPTLAYQKKMSNIGRVWH